MHHSKLIERFPDHAVLVLGDVMLDEYLSGECSRISPEAPVPVLAVNKSRVVLGGAANTAHNVTALGGRAILIGAIGRDQAGRDLAHHAQSAGVEFIAIQHDGPTVRKVRVVGQQQQLLRLDYESVQAPAPDVESRVMEQIEAHVPRCAVVVISDYAKGLLSEGLVQRVIEAAHRNERRVVIDPRPQHAAFYPGCDYLTPNWKEALGLLGEPEQPATPARIDEIGRRLALRFKASILLTLGAKGISVFGPDGHPRFSEPASAREVFDVSGAGDTVVATFALSVAAGAPDRDATALANRAAGIAVGKLGTATVSPAELLDDDARQTRLLDRAQLTLRASALRQAGKRLVTINGSFDVLHAGHLHILREARRQGDVLIVGVNSDRSVRAYKGPDRPFVGQADRAAMLLALRDVDFVHVFDEDVPMPFIESARPHVHVNGAEYGPECIEARVVQTIGARLHLIARVPGLSTSSLADRIRREPVA